MGNPRFDKTKRYKNSKGQKFGKGVWFDENDKVIRPGQGFYDEDNKLLFCFFTYFSYSYSTEIGRPMTKKAKRRRDNNSFKGCYCVFLLINFVLDVLTS